VEDVVNIGDRLHTGDRDDDAHRTSTPAALVHTCATTALVAAGAGK